MSSLPDVPAPWLTVTMALSVMATKSMSFSSLSSPTLISSLSSQILTFFLCWDDFATAGLRFSPDAVVEGSFFLDCPSGGVVKDNERAVAELPPEVRGAGPAAFLVAYGLRWRLINPLALPEAYGLRLILGEIRVPAAEVLPLSFARRALGDDMVVGNVLLTATRTEIYVANIEARCLASNLDGFRPAPESESGNYLARFDIGASKIESRCHLTSILHGLPVPSSFDFRCLDIESSNSLARFDIRACKIESKCHLTSILDGQVTVI